MTDKKTAAKLHKKLKGAKNFKRRYSFAEATTAMYDDLCSNCKRRVVLLKQRNHRIQMRSLCPQCKQMAKEKHEEKLNEALQ